VRLTVVVGSQLLDEIHRIVQQGDGITGNPGNRRNHSLAFFLQAAFVVGQSLWFFQAERDFVNYEPAVTAAAMEW